MKATVVTIALAAGLTLGSAFPAFAGWREEVAALKKEVADLKKTAADLKAAEAELRASAAATAKELTDLRAANATLKTAVDATTTRPVVLQKVLVAGTDNGAAYPIPDTTFAVVVNTEQPQSSFLVTRAFTRNVPYRGLQPGVVAYFEGSTFYVSAQRSVSAWALYY